MILLIDNYDSFVHNLARYFERLGQATHVVRNDAIDAAAIAALAPQAVVLSPGPCTPAEAGCSLESCGELAGSVPILGVCLGHQAIAAAFGGSVVRAAEPMHGRTSEIFHDGQSVFAGLPNPLGGLPISFAGRRRATLPAALEVTAWTADGTIMAIAHRELPIVGLQFHPESILTDCGLRSAGGLPAFGRHRDTGALPDIASERVEPNASEPALPSRPVTF